VDQPADDVAAIDALKNRLPLLLAIALPGHDDIDDVSQSGADGVNNAAYHHPVVLFAKVVRLL